ncbi:MAG TPA: NAD(P)/FAD-dependent oxidoreductase [Thermodesulfobacteriota bacterium]|nr:NAD(P)/FAD-dependent oxidoreductase [Thermodesulfobacteriota bacterium]
MKKSIIIIGAGMGGLSAGCYGQMNGYDTQIFEMHSLPGGQCASWKRKGYTFDACIHHLFGCSPSSKIYQLWNELGAMPRELVQPLECTSVLSPDGRLFIDYYDLDWLEEHLNRLSPVDSKAIQEYVRAIKGFTKGDLLGEMMLGSAWSIIKTLPSVPTSMKWFRMTMHKFAGRFFDPFLRRAFSLLVYSMPSIPVAPHLMRHAYGISKALQWPVGGAFEFARSIEKRYSDLGGKIHYHQKVEKVLVENDKAVGIKVADGTEHRADIVISNGDGRRTVMEMLGGKYINERIRSYCGEPPDETNWAVHVFLGVNRDLSGEPSAMVMLLDQPVTLADHKNDSLEMQIYGFDRTMAPEGKGVIKVELVSSYSYWRQLYADKQRYEEEKQKVAGQVIDILENHFHGIRSQVEVIDVPTLMTWERFMGGTHGFNNMPNKKPGFVTSMRGRGGVPTLPGLADFYFVGVWASMSPSLFGNALSGRKVIQALCKKDGRRFLAAEFAKI